MVAYGSPDGKNCLESHFVIRDENRFCRVRMKEGSNIRLKNAMKAEIMKECRKSKGLKYFDSDVMITITKVQNVSRETLPHFAWLW